MSYSRSGLEVSEKNSLKGDRKFPREIMNKLPESARDIYSNAFNNAWNHYRRAQDCQNLSREEIAHLVAWASLEQSFHKSSRGYWVPD